MLTHLKHLGRRLLVMIGGEVLQSVFHFALNILLVHALPAWDYGIFAIVMLIGGLVLTYMRSLAAMPASLLIPAHRERRRAGVFAVTFGSGAVALAILAALGVAAGLMPWLGSTALVAGTFVGLWAFRSFVRTLLYALQRQSEAIVSDIVYVASGFILAAAFVRGHDQALLTYVFTVLAAANGLAIAAGLWRLPMRISFGAGMRRRYRSVARQLGWSCAGVTTANIQGQGQVALIAALAGPAAYAPIAGMMVFSAPLRLVASALANMMQPELARLVAQDEWSRIRHMLFAWTAAMLGMGLAYGCVLALALPFIDSPTFNGQPKLLLACLTWGAVMAMLLYVMPRILLEVLRAFRVIATLTTASAVVGMGIVASLLVTLGPAWSLVGSVMSEVMVVVWCWGAVLGGGRRADHSRDRLAGSPIAPNPEAA